MSHGFFYALIRRSKKAITLRDLVKPDLGRREERAIKSALKNAKRDQDAIRAKARRPSK